MEYTEYKPTEIPATKLTPEQELNKDILRRKEQKGILSHLTNKPVIISSSPDNGEFFKNIWDEQTEFAKPLPLIWDDINPTSTNVYYRPESNE